MDKEYTKAMDYRRKLFLRLGPYDWERSKAVFLDAVKQNIRQQAQRCPEYAQLLQSCGFAIEDLRSEADLHLIPVLPTLYLKRNRLFSMPEDKMAVTATSSGTKGLQSMVGFDRKTLFYGIGMMLRFFSYHKVISLLPTNYIVLGYEPGKHNRLGAAQTAYGTTKFTPALHREYALKYTGSGYTLNAEGIIEAVRRYARQGFPVRFVGFPQYMFLLAKTLRDRGLSVKLNRRSRILLGGGWKQLEGEQADEETFFRLIEETLGLGRENCCEFFSAAEHPIAYCKCENGHFHVPAYSRVIIRNVHTLQPVPDGQLGLLSFVTPLVASMPLVSIVTDDLAVLSPGGSCGCGIQTPCFTLHGRAGIRQIKTCTAGAAELLGGVQ